MGVSEQIAKEWSEQKLAAEAYYMSNEMPDGGISALEIYQEWQQHLTFQEFVDGDRSITRKQKDALLFEQGKPMPLISSGQLERYRNPQGYHVFKKFCPVVREEYLFSQFSAACGFLYAPVLPSTETNQLYTPKLGNNVTSLYGLLINALKKEHSDVPDVLRSAFERAVIDFGSPDKIPYKSLLRVKPMGGTDSHEFEGYYEWAKPFFERDKIFLNKMLALLGLTGTLESFTNPTNLIVNAQTGRFIYAIDQAPRDISFSITSVSEGVEVRNIAIGDLIDPDIIRDMQTIMKEKLSDDLIENLMMRIRAISYSIDQEFATIDGVSDFETRLKLYGDGLKSRRDNPSKVVDPQTRQPV